MLHRLFSLLRSQTRWRRFDRALLIAIVVGGLCWFLLPYSAHRGQLPQATSQSAPYPLTWRGNEGIYLKTADDRTPRTYNLRTRSGDIIPNPVYNFWNHQLVYWSRRDKALRFLSLNAPARWINMPEKIDGYEVSIGSISPTRDGLLLDLRTAGAPSEVWYLDPDRKSFATIKGAVSSRGSDGYTTFMTVDNQGIFYAVSAGKRVRIDGVHLSPDGLWDYSARNDTLCARDARTITVLHDGRRSTWELRGDKDLFIESVYVEPRHNQLYFSLAGKPIRGRKLIATDANGKRDKTVLKSYSSFHYPFRLADDETQRLIQQLGPSQ